MQLRRALLTLGLAGLVFSAAHPGAAATDAEVAAYGGESHGGWICGPMGAVRYGGVGANVHVAERSRTSAEGEGLSATAGASAEIQRVTLSCGDACPTQEERSQSTASGVDVGGHVRAGYAGRWVGVALGGGVYPAREDAGSKTATATWYPEIEVEAGRMHGPVAIYGVAGVGAPNVTTIQRPGAFVGASAETASRMGVDVRVGEYRAGPAPFDDVEPRLDVTGRLPISRALSLRVGGAIGTAHGAVDPELSAGLAAQF